MINTQVKIDEKNKKVIIELDLTEKESPKMTLIGNTGGWKKVEGVEFQGKPLKINAMIGYVR